MSNLQNNNLVSINSNSFILCNPNLNDLIQNNISNLSIIYFVEDFKNTNPIIQLLDNKYINKILVISKKHDTINNKEIEFCFNVNSHATNSLTENILTILDINNNYNFLKFAVNNFRKLLTISSKSGKSLHFKYCNLPVICAISDNESIYFNDLLNCMKALLIDDHSKQYEFIYDTVCDYLDSKFCNNNFCDFKNDQCVANRNKCSSHSTMGCCYSFSYTNFFNLRPVKNVKLCQHMKNRSCSTKNISCKLFTCKYLRKQNIKFNTHKILLLECFFNKKQHDIIQSNFFRTREEILQKLQEENCDLYNWYILRQKYIIK